MPGGQAIQGFIPLLAMSEEYHAPESGVAVHFEEELEISALAHRYYEEEGRPEGRAREHWERAEREVHSRRSGVPQTVADPGVEPGEEAMHLGQ